MIEKNDPGADDPVDPEGVVREWIEETNPDKIDDPAFEITAEDDNFD